MPPRTDEQTQGGGGPELECASQHWYTAECDASGQAVSTTYTDAFCSNLDSAYSVPPAMIMANLEHYVGGVVGRCGHFYHPDAGVGSAGFTCPAGRSGPPIFTRLPGLNVACDAPCTDEMKACDMCDSTEVPITCRCEIAADNWFGGGVIQPPFEAGSDAFEAAGGASTQYSDGTQQPPAPCSLGGDGDRCRRESPQCDGDLACYKDDGRLADEGDDDSGNRCGPPPPRGGENEACEEDGTCDGGLTCVTDASCEDLDCSDPSRFGCWNNNECRSEWVERENRQMMVLPPVCKAPLRCDFQAMMREVNEAMTSGEMWRLRDGDTVYKKCEEVKHLVGDVRLAGSCPGRTTDEEHGDSPAPPAYDGAMDGTACTEADAIRVTYRGMTCAADDTRDTDCGADDGMCVGDCPGCRERHPYRQCELAWEQTHPFTPSCEACFASLGEAGAERWSECMSPVLTVPPCPSEDQAQWPEACRNLETDFYDCCPCIGGGDCPPECETVPKECHGILRCTTAGADGGPVCPILWDDATGR